MPAFTPVNALVKSVDTTGERAVVEIDAARSTMVLDLAADSAWLRYLTEGAIVKYTIEVVQAGVPAPDQITNSQSLTNVEQGRKSGIIDPNTGEFLTGETFVTPVEDVPPPVVTDEHPSVATSGVAAAPPIDDVKKYLGL